MMKWFYVTVTIDDETFEDAIKGYEPREALINASDNWLYATDIKLTGKEELI
jgi:hypothetical protein